MNIMIDDMTKLLTEGYTITMLYAKRAANKESSITDYPDDVTDYCNKWLVYIDSVSSKSKIWLNEVERKNFEDLNKEIRDWYEVFKKGFKEGNHSTSLEKLLQKIENGSLQKIAESFKKEVQDIPV